MEQAADTEPWGWTAYFDNIKSFLQDLSRKFGLCNLRYAEYAVERLDICLGSIAINLVIDQFNDALQDRTTTNQSEAQSEEETRIFFVFYRGQLEELIICIQQIAIE